MAREGKVHGMGAMGSIEVWQVVDKEDLFSSLLLLLSVQHIRDGRVGAFVNSVHSATRERDMSCDK